MHNMRIAATITSIKLKQNNPPHRIIINSPKIMFLQDHVNINHHQTEHQLIAIDKSQTLIELKVDQKELDFIIEE